MFEEGHEPTRVQVSRTRIIARLLEVTGVGVALAAGIWSGPRFLRLGQGQADVDFVTVIAVLVAGMAGCMLMWGLAEVLRRLAGAGGSARDRATAAAGWESVVFDGGQRPAADVDGQMAGVVELLRELRDITLLSDEQRARRLESQGRALAEELGRLVPALLREHRWREARQRIQQARERFPSFAEFARFEQQIEQARAQVEEHDVAQAERQVRDLAELGAWERAEEVVRELLERHPDSERTRSLAASVRGRHEQAQAEQRSRLMGQAQEATRQRDWATALQCAQEVISRFPKSVEAESLRLQLPTLQANVEIQARQRMEAHIRDCVQQRRFDEALRTANELIDRYPNSPQAEALRAQLPKLQQRVALMGPRYA